MAVPSAQYRGNHEISSKNGFPIARNDFHSGSFENIPEGVNNSCLPQGGTSGQNGFNEWHAPVFNGEVPVRNRSPDGDMGNVEGAFPKRTQRADSAIDMGDDEEEYRPPKRGISPLTILGAGRVDPFANYPVKMDITGYWLLDHGKVFKQLVLAWV